MLTYETPDYHLQMWHQRLGQPSLTYLKHLISSFKHTNLSLDCEDCVLAKSQKHSYSPSITHSTRPFCLIYSDVDDYTCISRLYLLMIILV